MKKFIKKVYSVCRLYATKTPVTVGDYDTFSDAETAMKEHYNANPKRGKIEYSISLEDIWEMDGIVFRSITVYLSSGERTYWKYSGKELAC